MGTLINGVPKIDSVSGVQTYPIYKTIADALFTVVSDEKKLRTTGLTQAQANLLIKKYLLADTNDDTAEIKLVNDLMVYIYYFTIPTQDESNFNDSGDNGTFNPGTGYASSDEITLSDGTVIQVDTADMAGAVEEFTVLTSGLIGTATANNTLDQASTDGGGSGFTLTLGNANQTTADAIFLVVESPFTVAEDSYNVNYSEPNREQQNVTVVAGASAVFLNGVSNINTNEAFTFEPHGVYRPVVFYSDDDYRISNASFFFRLNGGEGGGINSITGMNVVNTDPLNPVIRVIQKTVAQMQTLSGSDGFVVGQLYEITDAANGYADLFIRAASVSELETLGFGFFKNGNMSVFMPCSIWYDLDTDNVKRIYEQVSHNDVCGNAVYTVPFDNNLWTNNIIINSDITWDAHSFINNCIINGGTVIGFNYETDECFLTGCQVGANCIITLTNGASLTNCTVGASANIAGQSKGADFINCKFGDGSNVTILDGTFNACEIGEGKIVNTTSLLTYSPTGKVYIGDKSTFEISSTDSAAVNPDSGNTIDMSAFPFAGILITDDTTNFLAAFVNFPTDHKFVVKNSSGTPLDVKDATAVGGNSIYLEAAGTIISIDGSVGDFLEFEYEGVAGRVIKSNGYIRS